MKWKKDQYKAQDKILIVDKLIDHTNRKKQETLLFEATDRILYAHRNMKLLIFLTSGPFFVGLWAFKYSLKLAILYFLYNKTTGKKKPKLDTTTLKQFDKIKQWEVLHFITEMNSNYLS